MRNSARFRPFACPRTAHSWVAGVLLFGGFLTVCLELGILWRFSLSRLDASSNTASESQLIKLPKSEKARRLWLLMNGARYGLAANAEVDVICTCKCCGDRCSMGAACCCSAEKFPVSRPMGLCRLVSGCSQAAPESPPTFPDSMRFLLPPPCQHHSFSDLLLRLGNSFLIPSGILPEPPTPVPKFASD